MMILICLNCLNDSFLSIALLKLPWKRNEPENNPKRGLIFYQKFHGNESKKLKSESVRQIKLNKKKKVKKWISSTKKIEKKKKKDQVYENDIYIKYICYFRYARLVQSVESEEEEEEEEEEEAETEEDHDIAGD